MGARLLTDDADDGAGGAVVHGRGQDAARRARAVVRQPRRPGGLRRRRRGQGAARPAPDGPRRACRASVHRREADARARRGALAIGRTRDPCVRAGHRTRWPGPHLGRLRNRRGSDRSLRAGDPHGADPRQCADGSRSPGRHLQLDDPDLLARLRHVGRLEHHRQRQLPKSVEHQDRVAAADAVRSGSGFPRTRTSTPARSRTCASSVPHDR